MSYVVDRRLNAKNKSTVNRQRFLRRYKEHIKRAVSDAVNSRSITDVKRGEKISIPARDISEPQFQSGAGGRSERVHPGNREFSVGDRIERPQGGGGGGGAGEGASDQGDGMDEFAFQITQDEFLNFMFDDLELPNLVKRQLKGSDEFRLHRAGVSNSGNPGRINIVRSLRAAHARRIALGGIKRKQIRELEAALYALLAADELVRDDSKIEALKEEIFALKAKLTKVPWLDDFDLKYNLLVKHPVPKSKAVMFCLMDVSGSMTQETKDLAKRFFILLYLFLQRNYERTDVVFIRHHTSAKEVDEQDFFYSRETGGTIVSSALNLMTEVIEERYSPAEWNIYGAQASDGDNWNDDSSLCRELMVNKILPLAQYFSYIEITPRQHQALWEEYAKVAGADSHAFAMRQIKSAADIYPVFRELFQKKIHEA